MRRLSCRSRRTMVPAFVASTQRQMIRRTGFQPGLNQLEDRTLLATLIWTNSTGGDWDWRSARIGSLAGGASSGPLRRTRKLVTGMSSCSPTN